MTRTTASAGVVMDTALIQKVWTDAMTAAIGGICSTESESYSFGHVADVARRAARIADYAVREFNMRGQRGWAKAIPTKVERD